MPEVSGVQYVGGNFMVDGQQLDLGTLMMKLNLDRTQQIDRQIADQMGEISKRNEKLRALNDLLAKCRQLKENDTGDQTNLTLIINGQTVTKQIHNDAGGTDDWESYFGLSGWTDADSAHDDKERDSKWDANISVIKGAIDSLNSDSQLDMIRLQNLIDKRNQAFQLATDMVKKDAQSKDGIIRNIGQ